MTQHFFSFFPQFTADPLNDRAWGKGFTDWDLIRALPEGRRAAFTPALGYYDPTTERYLSHLGEQLAALPLAGAGLMVYHYYFDGTHVLPGFERQLLNHPNGPPFFFCWANETWTKRWVGRPRDIIIGQRHLLDAQLIEKHAQYLARFFELPNYHRIDGRPLFVIYNSRSSATLGPCLEMYRAEFARLGLRPLMGACLGYPQPPAWLQSYDFACEFEPRFFFNTQRGSRLASAAARLKAHFPQLFEWLGTQRDRLRAHSGNRVFSYRNYLAGIGTGRIERDLRASAGGLPLMRSTFLGWDNTPRYGERSTVVDASDLEARDFDILRSLRSDGQLPILVNSWNEWSEGAALEPAAGVGPWRERFLAALSSTGIGAQST